MFSGSLGSVQRTRGSNGGKVKVGNSSPSASKSIAHSLSPELIDGSCAE